MWQKFHQVQLEPNESILNFITRVQKLTKQLKDLGQEASDESIIAKILMSLPEQYNSFRSAWDSTELNRQTMENLVSRLVKEETILSQSQIHQQTALISNAQPVHNRSQNYKNNNNNNNQRSFRKNGQNPHANKICNYCQLIRHIEKTCRKKFRDSKRQNKNKNSTHQGQYCQSSSNSNQANFSGCLVATVIDIAEEQANATYRSVQSFDSDLSNCLIGFPCIMNQLFAK